MERADSSEWYRDLSKKGDYAWRCSKCGAYHFYDIWNECQYCGERRSRMETKKILEVINVWLAVEKTLVAGSEEGTWAHGRHCGSIEYLEQVKLLLSSQPKAESFEEKALESFKALVSSEESKKFMKDYYGHD